MDEKTHDLNKKSSDPIEEKLNEQTQRIKAPRVFETSKEMEERLDVFFGKVKKKNIEEPSAIQADDETAQEKESSSEDKLFIEEEKPQVSHAKAWIITGIVGACLIGGGFAAVPLYDKDIVQGVTLSGEMLGELPPEIGQVVIISKSNGLLNQTLTLTSMDRAESFSLKELGAILNTQEIIDKSYSWGHQGSILQRYQERKKALSGKDFQLGLSWDKDKLTKILHETLDPMNKPAVNAKYTVDVDQSIQILPSQTGQEVDVDLLVTQIQALDIYHLQSLSIPLKSLAPEISEQQLKEQTLLSSFSTEFTGSSASRAHNIQLAANTLNGITLKPGETFSFNESVGERTVEKGYQEAPVIQDGELMPGIGGGICQVSSTLYNTVLNGKLENVERHPHSLPVAYVSKGKDATVAWGALDYKFKNNTQDLIMIKTMVHSNILTIELYKTPLPQEQDAKSLF